MSQWRIKRIWGQVLWARVSLLAITGLMMTCLPLGSSEHHPLSSNSVIEENIRVIKGQTVDTVRREKHRPIAQTRIRSNLKNAALNTSLDHGTDTDGYASTIALKHDEKVIVGEKFIPATDNAFNTNETLDGSGYGLASTWWQGCTSTPFTGGTYDCDRRLNYGTFTLNSPSKLNAVHIWIGGFNNWGLPGEPYLKLEIYLGNSTSSATSSALIATSDQTLVPNSYPTGAERTFTFANSVALSANTPYTIRIFVPSGTRGDLGASQAYALYGATLTQQVAAYNDTALLDPCSDILAGKDGCGALNNRTPVILIHGIHGNQTSFGFDTTAQPNTEYFKNLVTYLNKSNSYNLGFKTYRFHYVSDKYSIWEIAEALRQRIDEMDGAAGRPDFRNKPIIIIAHSMGGIITRQYLLLKTQSGNDPRYTNRLAGERVIKLITLATPHHGTYSANGLARTKRFASFLSPLKAVEAAGVFYLADTAYWTSQGCPACILDLQHANRGALLWDNSDNRWSASYLSALSYLEPSESNFHLPTNSYYNQKIFAYWGEYSVTDTAWQTLKSVKDAKSIKDFIGKFKANGTLTAYEAAISASKHPKR